MFGDLRIWGGVFGEEFGEGALGLGEGLGVGLIVVGLTVFPHAEEDADPFEGAGAEGGVAAGASGAFGFVEGFGRRCFMRGTSVGSGRRIRGRFAGGTWDRRGGTGPIETFRSVW